jgi:hypothetical protein
VEALTLGTLFFLLQKPPKILATEYHGKIMYTIYKKNVWATSSSSSSMDPQPAGLGNIFVRFSQSHLVTLRSSHLDDDAVRLELF